MDKQNGKIIEKWLFVTCIGKVNENHRAYSEAIVDKWNDHEGLSGEAPGIEVEYGLGDVDIEKEFISSTLSCGVVTQFKKEDGILYGLTKFKINDLTKDIYSGKINVDDLTLGPKGKGSVKNQEVQDDYELIGFNLLPKEENSSYVLEETEKETA